VLFPLRDSRSQRPLLSIFELRCGIDPLVPLLSIFYCAPGKISEIKNVPLGSGARKLTITINHLDTFVDTTVGPEENHGKI